MAAKVESEGAYMGSPSAHSEASYIDGISDTESGEDEDLTLHSHRSIGDKPTTGAEGGDNNSSTRQGGQRGLKRGHLPKHVARTGKQRKEEGRHSTTRDLKGAEPTIFPTATSHHSNTRHGAIGCYRCDKDTHQGSA